MWDGLDSDVVYKSSCCRDFADCGQVKCGDSVQDPMMSYAEKIF